MLAVLMILAAVLPYRLSVSFTAPAFGESLVVTAATVPATKPKFARTRVTWPTVYVELKYYPVGQYARLRADTIRCRVGEGVFWERAVDLSEPYIVTATAFRWANHTPTFPLRSRQPSGIMVIPK